MAPDEFEELAAYEPYDFPPRSWYVGPSDSDRQATGIAYFRVGKNAITRIARSRTTGDVYIHSRGSAPIVHTSRGWALLAEPQPT